jgi:hypothetical protein
VYVYELSVADVLYCSVLYTADRRMYYGDNSIVIHVTPVIKLILTEVRSFIYISLDIYAMRTVLLIECLLYHPFTSGSICPCSRESKHISKLRAVFANNIYSSTCVL